MTSEDEEDEDSYGFRDPSDPFDPVDDDEHDPGAGPGPDDGGDEVSNAVALLEAALERSIPAQPIPAQSSPAPPHLAQRSPLELELLPIVDALDVELAKTDDYLGARSCVGCRELVLDDFDHDFCEAEEPTEKMARPELPEPSALRWNDSLRCPNCQRCKPVELVAPPRAIECRIFTCKTVTCSCGVSMTVTYSWSLRAVVALRYQKTKPEVLN